MRPLKLQTMLLATDLRDEFVPMLASARELARLANARLHVVHATEEPPSDSALHDHLQRGGVVDAAEARSVRGPAGAIISQEAARVGADVVVLGGHRGARTNPLGSTADRVVRTARTPCLILPAPLHLPLTTVLVPVDTAEPAQGVLDLALSWASALRQRPPSQPTRLVAVHVAGQDAGAAAPALKTAVEDVRRRLGDVVGVKIEEAIEESGDAAGAIIEAATSRSADLVVMGTRGEKALGGALLGSVSSAVVQHAVTPVLLVPPGLWR